MPDTAITFREAGKRDEDFLVDVTLQTMKGVFESSVGQPLTKEGILEIVRSCDVNLIVEREGRPIGYTSFTYTRPGRLYWASLVVAPEEQGNGVAKEILRHVIQTARARGVRFFDAHVQLHNRKSMNYWFRRGFRPSGYPFQGSLPICLVVH